MPPPRPRQPGTSAALIIRVDDVEYAVRPDEITAMDASTIRRAVGMSFRALMEAAQADPDIDVIAALVWMARRQAGEPNLDYATVAAEIRYDSAFDLDERDVGPGEVPAGD